MFYCMHFQTADELISGLKEYAAIVMKNCFQLKNELGCAPGSFFCELIFVCISFEVTSIFKGSLFVKARVECIEVFGVKSILHHSKSLAESLKVYNFSFS